MSRAIPSSFNEYLLTTTNPDNLVIDGGIMPLRNSSDSTSLWYKYCLRGEDPIFLNEAMNIRGISSSGGSSINLTPTKYIQSGKMSSIKYVIGSAWRSGCWSSTAPQVQAGVLTSGQLWGDYLTPYFSLPSQ